MLGQISAANVSTPELTAISAQEFTTKVSADMFKAASGMRVPVGFTGNSPITFVFFGLGVPSYFFGDSSWILMYNLCDSSKRITVIQAFFNVDPV